MAQQTDKYSNPPFDPRIYSMTKLQAPRADQWGKPDVQRGYMIQDQGVNGDTNIRYSVRFLYNPSNIEVTHSTDVQYGSIITPQAYRNPADGGNFNVPVQASVGFNLLFDRTYEMWDIGSKSANSLGMAAVKGCVVDVEAVYRVVGILQPTVGFEPGVPRLADRNPDYILNQGDIGPMPMTPCTVYFGGSNALSYHGYVSGLDVNYTHFSQAMIPVRCSVGVTMTLIPAANWSTTGGN